MKLEINRNDINTSSKDKSFEEIELVDVDVITEYMARSKVITFVEGGRTKILKDFTAQVNASTVGSESVPEHECTEGDSGRCVHCWEWMGCDEDTGIPTPDPLSENREITCD